MKIKDGLEEAYKKSIQIDKDKPISGYVQAIIDYSNKWAELMEVAIEKGESFEDCAERTSYEADTEGITGNMYGNASAIICTYWVHGDSLKKWHNTKYGRPDAKGVVNPAIMCVSKRE